MSLTSASRVCIRCGKELTDAASMEAGIGPICRKLDNAVLAASIPADVEQARESLSAVEKSALVEESVPTFNNVFGALFATDADTRTDWRKEVKRIEWLLSFPQNVESCRAALTNVARGLGYVGLAALWDGKASTGVAMMRCAEGRVFIAAPRNADFRYAVKQINGWRFHPNPDGDRPEWSVPVLAHVALNPLVMTHYPNCPTREQVIAQAATLAQSALTGAPMGAVAAATAKVRVLEADGWINVYAPYNAGFIADVKQMPYPNRKWNSVDRCWQVAGSRKSELSDLLLKHYRESPLVLMVPPQPVAQPVPQVKQVAPLSVLPF